MLISRLVSSSALKIEGVCSSGWLWTDNIPEDRTLHDHSCENFKSYVYLKHFWEYVIT
jgi:hypothetical protein